MNFFPVVKSRSISPVFKTFNPRMRNFIILLCPHCTMVTICLQCIMKKILVPAFQRSLLITYLLTLREKKYCFGKIVIVFGESLEKVLNFKSKNLYKPCTT